MRRKRKVQSERLFLNIQAIVTLTFLALVSITIIDSPKEGMTPLGRRLLSGIFIIMFFLVSLYLAKKHHYNKLVWMMIGAVALALAFYGFVLK